jgi:hypothetical protein
VASSTLTRAKPVARNITMTRHREKIGCKTVGIFITYLLSASYVHGNASLVDLATQ